MFRLACSGRGVVTLMVPGLAAGVLARGRYRCSGHRAVVRLSLSQAVAGKMARLGQALGEVSFSQGHTVERLSVTLGVRPPTVSYWISNLGLRCNAAVFEPQLLSPNFSDTPATTIDVRPWLAWYTQATGWHWLGTEGPNKSRWYEWTAGPTGVAEWQTSGGNITPWMWSPLSVVPGHGTYLIAVFEAIYWYVHPEYVWSYARSINDEGATATYCSYS